jgi:hypothetical protein
MSSQISDDEIVSIIEEEAEDHDVPPELLLDIYEAERAVVNMERRGRILKEVKELLEDHVENEE